METISRRLEDGKPVDRNIPSSLVHILASDEWTTLCDDIDSIIVQSLLQQRLTTIVLTVCSLLGPLLTFYGCIRTLRQVSSTVHIGVIVGLIVFLVFTLLRLCYEAHCRRLLVTRLEELCDRSCKRFSQQQLSFQLDQRDSPNDSQWCRFCCCQQTETSIYLQIGVPNDLHLASLSPMVTTDSGTLLAPAAMPPLIPVADVMQVVSQYSIFVFPKV